MELGEKLRQARMEAGLSQRQLCGEEVPRNMLSQIEHGTANPSMKTLQYLAARLGKSVSYFLEETAVVSPNRSVMESARRLYDAGDFAGTALVLEGYREPDQVYDREKQIWWVLTHLNLAEQAIYQGREPYAKELLEKATVKTAYCAQELERHKLLLLGRIRGEKVSNKLPSLDEELRLRSEEALAEGDAVRAARLLDAAEDQKSPRWSLLRGVAYMAAEDYQNAAQCFRSAESTYPKETAAKLECCYRELGDYKRAYEYACKQKEK